MKRGSLRNSNQVTLLSILHLSTGEALMEETEIFPEGKNDWWDVHHYTKALNAPIGEFKNLPISSRLIKQTHKNVLNSLRGVKEP